MADIDSVIIAGDVLLPVTVGSYFIRRQESPERFFLADRLGWRRPICRYLSVPALGQLVDQQSWITEEIDHYPPRRADVTGTRHSNASPTAWLSPVTPSRVSIPSTAREYQ